MSENSNLKDAFANAHELVKHNNLNEAIEQLTEILKHDSRNINALSLLIEIYIKQNNIDMTLASIEKTLAIDSTNKRCLQQKVKIYQLINNEIAYQDSLEILHKNYPTIESSRLLSNLLLSKGEDEKSDDVIQSFFESNKSYSDLYKGIRHAKAGRVKLAEDVYKKVLIKDKNNVDALRLLGLLAFKTKNYDTAEKLYIRALTINPNFALAWDNLAKLYRIQNKLAKSIPAFKNLLKLDPNNFEALVSLGTIFTKLAKYQEGIDMYKEALLINPSNARVYLSMGHALKTLGNRSECEKSYKNAIKYFHLSGEAFWSLANLKTYKFSDSEISNMESSIQENMQSDELIQMHFALGKAYETNKDFNKSFENYKKGNWLQRKQVDYNSENHKKSIDELISFFSSNKELLQTKTGSSSADPIFILGLPRSGSTLIEQILSSHSLIEGTQELPNIMATSKKIRLIDDVKGYPNNLNDLSDNEFLSFGEDYINDTKWTRSNKPFFIDKMPNNFVHIGLIKMILPNAKIIDARRNPMDTCFSCYKQYFAKGQHFTYDLDDISRYYKDYLRLMQFWNDLLPGSIYTINYEDVITNPEIEIPKLLDYCDVKFEKSCLEFYKSKRPVKTASSEQVRQPMYKTGLDYWDNYSDNLEILIKHFPEYAK